MQSLIKFDKERDKLSSSLQGLTLFLICIWTVIFIMLHSIWYKYTNITFNQMILMFSMIWTTAIFQFWASEQRVLLNYKRLVILTVIVSIAKPVLGIIFVTNSSDKVTARIFGLALVELVAFIWLFFAQVKRGKTFFSAKFWQYCLRLSIPLIPHYLSQTLLATSDRIMISNMVGTDKAGIYSLAYSISQVMLIFGAAIMDSISPWIYKKIKDDEAQDIQGIGYITMIFVAGVNILYILLAPEIVRLFAPVEYYEAIWVIPPIAMSVYFMYAYDFFAKFEFYYEKTTYISAATMFGAILNIVLNYIFIKIFGYMAAGYTTLVCYMIYTCLHYFFMKKICKTKMPNKKVFNTKLLILITSVFMGFGFGIMLFYNITIVRYIIVIIILIVMYLKRDVILRIKNIKEN